MSKIKMKLGLSTAGTTIVGDTMETDILGGVQLGYRTVLVLSGSTQRRDLPNYAFQPELILDSVASPELLPVCLTAA